MIWLSTGRTRFCTLLFRAYVTMKMRLVAAYGAADSTSIEAIDMYAAACCLPNAFLAPALMYNSRETRRMVRITLSEIEMMKYGRVNWTVVVVQSEALGREA